MGWLTLKSPDGGSFYDVLDEIKDGSDRATAIVAAAFVEDHLTVMLKQRLVQDAVNKDRNPIEDMFKGGGPLGDFSNKIDLAYLLSRISKEACLELHEIRRIRNDFAHDLQYSSFNAPKIARRCDKFSLWSKIKLTMRPADTDKKGRIVVTVGGDPDEESQLLPVVDVLENEGVSTPRERFIAACQFYIAVFSVIVSEQPNLKSPVI